MLCAVFFSIAQQPRCGRWKQHQELAPQQKPRTNTMDVQLATAIQIALTLTWQPPLADSSPSRSVKDWITDTWQQPLAALSPNRFASDWIASAIARSMIGRDSDSLRPKLS